MLLKVGRSVDARPTMVFPRVSLLHLCNNGHCAKKKNNGQCECAKPPVMANSAAAAACPPLPTMRLVPSAAKPPRCCSRRMATRGFRGIQRFVCFSSVN
jgi:hypothetical protein